MRPAAEPAAPEQPTFDGAALERALTGIEGVTVQDTPEGARIVLASDVTFASGRTDLNKKAQGALRRVALALKETPGVTGVRIEGHTDSQPIQKSGWASNEELSVARARQVKKYLLNQGISGELITVDGFGEAQPIASNKTKAGREKNRRVEIAVLGD